MMTFSMDSKPSHYLDMKLMSHSDLNSVIFSTFQTETIDLNDSFTQKMDHIHPFESFQTGFM